MAGLTEENVRNVLRRVENGGISADLTPMIAAIRIDGGAVTVMLEADPQEGPRLEGLRQAAERAIGALPGVARPLAILTAQRKASAHGPRIENLAPQIKRIIAVASGKGGVGKSTVAANLALALNSSGHKTGLLDADIYGPSIPRLLGLPNEKPKFGPGGKLIPPEAYGLTIMSMGLMVEEEKPMIWRGPMIQSAIRQLLADVDWGPLDILVVDMPPGTGDAQLTLVQKVPLAGAVIVSTPQDIALIDARKGLNMFRQTGVPVLGLIENMSYFACPHCGGRTDIFGHGGARAEAEKLGCPFLGEIPLHADIRRLSDEGRPVAADAASAHGRIFGEIAGRLITALDLQARL